MSLADLDLEQSLLSYQADAVTQNSWRGEVKTLLALSAPVTVQLSSQYAIHVISQYFIGHRGATSLAAAAIGHTWFNVCWSFLIGVATALDTLGSQAYGNGRPQTVLSCCVSAIVVLLLLCLPLTAAMMAASHVAQTVFGQTPEEAAMVATFCQGLLPGAYPHVISIAILKGLQVQNMVWPPAVITIITSLASIPINLFFIDRFHFSGAALAKSASRTLQSVLFCGYLAWLCWPVGQSRASGALKDSRHEVVGCKKLSKAVVWEAAKEGLSLKLLKEFLVLGIPGGVMQAANSCSFDVTTVMASRLGENEVATHSILCTFTHLVVVALPLGISTAATIRVGNLLGANQASHARLAGFVAVALGTLPMVGIGLLVIALRMDIGALFINNGIIIGKVAAVVPICAAYLVVDAVNDTSSGILRALGQQARLMGFNIVGFWAAGFTLGWALTFKAGLGLPGIWLGILSGSAVLGLLCIWSLACIDWPREAAVACRRFLPIDGQAQSACLNDPQPAMGYIACETQDAGISPAVSAQSADPAM